TSGSCDAPTGNLRVKRADPAETAERSDRARRSPATRDVQGCLSSHLRLPYRAVPRSWHISGRRGSANRTARRPRASVLRQRQLAQSAVFRGDRRLRAFLFELTSARLCEPSSLVQQPASRPEQECQHETRQKN